MKFASIIPLIGGFAIGAKRALRNDPEFIISYPCFSLNDGVYLENYPHLSYKYFVIEDGSNSFLDADTESKFESKNKDVDIVVGVPPCGGLSQLNSSRSNGNIADINKARGPEAIQNRFIFNTAKFVLGRIKPKVYVLENAPVLSTNAGSKVLDGLREVASANGYSVSVYYTDTLLHGVPQRRRRTFCFFWKGSKSYILDWVNEPHKSLADYFAEIPEWATYNNREESKKEWKTSLYSQFMDSIGITASGARELGASTFLQLAFRPEFKDKYLNFINSNGRENTTEARVAKHVVNKIGMNMNFWDQSPIFAENDHVNAVISKNMLRFVLCEEDRYITMRECMHLMCLPHDFVTDQKKKYLITQNVPAKTAEDIVRLAVKALEEGKTANGNFLIQNNSTQRSIYPEESTKKNSIFSIMNGISNG